MTINSNLNSKYVKKNINIKSFSVDGCFVYFIFFSAVVLFRVNFILAAMTQTHISVNFLRNFYEIQPAFYSVWMCNLSHIINIRFDIHKWSKKIVNNDFMTGKLDEKKQQNRKKKIKLPRDRRKTFRSSFDFKRWSIR